MIALALIVVVMLVVAVCVMRFARPDYPIQSFADVNALSQPVDLDSFRNLIDPSEEAYLRSKLTAPEFRAIQRSRMLVAIQYVRSTAHNASLILEFANYAQGASNAEIVRAARELGNSAVQLRAYSLLAMLVFGTRYVFPSLPLTSCSIVPSYGRMCDRMSGLTRIQAPTSVAEVEAAL